MTCIPKPLIEQRIKNAPVMGHFLDGIAPIMSLIAGLIIQSPAGVGIVPTMRGKELIRCRSGSGAKGNRRA
jgi:hypothetical protein